MVRKHPSAECENCDLLEIGRYVPSDGPAKAKLALVGEAPGANEARIGRPFVGVSGQLLDRVLQYYHIDRSTALLTNACSCRPPDNATPSATAIRACRPRLLQELQDRGVDTVVAMGNSAAGTLLGTSGGITKLRIGPPRAVPELGIQVIPTLHPAACLRPKGDAFFPSIVNDFGKLFAPRDDWTEPLFIVIDDVDTAIKAVDELPTKKPITVDIETNVDKDVAFEHASRHQLLCVGIGYAAGKVVVFGETVCNDTRFLSHLGKYLRAHNRIIAQNGKFDLGGLFHRVGALRLWFDTMLASYCLDERRGIHGLKYLAVELLGAPRYDDEIKKYIKPGVGYGAIPRDILYRYNAYDCAATYALWQLFTTLLEKDPGLRALHDFLVRASNEIMYPELNGIGVDKEYNAELEEYYVRRLAVYRMDMQTTSGRPVFNPNSPKQIVEVLEEVFGVKVPRKRNQKGEWAKTTDAETIQSLMDKCPEPNGELYDFLWCLAEHRKDAKSYGTYVKGIRQRMYKGRVFPTYLLHGTTTGRLSSRNPNIQNITRGWRLRKQFVPCTPGNIFVQADYSQIEARILTWLAKEEYLRDIFNDPTRDLFDELTVVLYGGIPADKAAAKELRIRVKAYFYGLGYGREAKSIADEYGMSVPEAQRGMRAFFSVIPNIVQFREETRRAVKHGEDLTTPFGRRRRFYLITKENQHEIMNEALAFKPQSIASDTCLQAFTWIRPELKGIGWVRNLVHDSILVETSPDNVGRVSSIMRHHMQKSGRLVVDNWVNIDVDITTGTNWGEL